MLERLARFVVEKRIFVIMMGVALIIVGGSAVTTLPIEAFPDVQDVQVVVISQRPGQAPEEVERSISLPIERALAGTPGVNDIRSVSITGLSVVTLIFNDGTDDYFARSQVLEKLRDADLPDGVVPSLAPLSTAVGEVYRYVLDKPKDMPLYEARAIQDFVVRPALRMVPGVADVTSFGGSIKQYQILIRPDLLKRYGVTVADIQSAVGNANSNVGGGVIPRGDEVVVVRGIGLYQGIDDVGNTVVKAQNGNTVRVRDLGDVKIGTPERSGMVAYDHKDDVSEGIVTMVKGQNAAVVVAGVREEHRRAMTDSEQQLFGIDKLNIVRSTIPAVTHVDYSARVQTVHRGTNALYYRLIDAFKARTGCPVLVNTSFNVRGEPIVCTPEDAFRCFMGTDLDLLTVGRAVLRKDQQDPSLQQNYARSIAPD